MKYLKSNWWAISYLSVYFIIVLAVLLNRFWQFEAFYFDHGIFDGALWKVAHFQPPLIDHLGSSLLNQFGDHFTPSLYLLAPIYWVTSAYEAVLIAEALLVTASAFVVYLVARMKVKSTLGVFAILFGYTFFIGIQNMIIANLHSELIAILTLGLTLLFMEKRKWVLFWLMLALTLGAKENFVTIGLGIAIYLFFNRERKQGIAVAIFSIAYYFVATRVVIPYFANSPYVYEVGASNPGEYLINFVSPAIKTKTMLAAFSTFGFLPILAPSFLPAIGQDFFGRFVLNSGSSRWDLGLHYNATLAVLLAFGATIGAHNLEGTRFKKLIYLFAIFSIGATFYFHRFSYHGPLGLATNRDFYSHSRDLEFLRNFLNTLPQGQVIMTQNHLAAQLTHRSTVLLPRMKYEKFSPDIMAFDLRPGQNPNVYWPMQEQSIKRLVAKVKTDKNYKMKLVGKDQIYFVRIK